MSKAVSKSTSCLPTWAADLPRSGQGAVVFCLTFVLGLVAMADRSEAQSLRVLRLGLGEGTVAGTGISCGTDCNETFGSTTSVVLTASAPTGSLVGAWGGDCASTGTGAGTASGTCNVSVSGISSVRVEFVPATAIAPLTDVSPSGIATYLSAPSNAGVDSPEEFIAALPADFRQNWILMVRSESLQTGIATSPRILMPGQDSQNVFTAGMTEHSS